MMPNPEALLRGFIVVSYGGCTLTALLVFAMCSILLPALSRGGAAEAVGRCHAKTSSVIGPRIASYGRHSNCQLQTAC